MSAATDPGAGSEGSTEGNQARLSKAIISPVQNEAPTLPAAIITPSASAPIDPPDDPPEVPTLPGPPVCGNMAREAGEVCDSSVDPCCEQDCSGLLGAGTTCRPANGACDLAEVCDGESRACPPDRVASSEQGCRAKSDEPCDASERCTGETKDCPPDLPAPAGTVCGQPSMPCDAPELCDGVSRACPPAGVSVAPATQVCRAATGECDAEEHCDGASLDCPSDVLRAQGSECRPVMGVCDVPEFCDGATPLCPDDDYLVHESPCRPVGAGEACGLPEYCDGSGPDCPPDVHAKDNLCGGDRDGCRGTSVCPGNTPVCPFPADTAPDGTACHNADGVCQRGTCCPGTTGVGEDGLCYAADGAKLAFVSSSQVLATIGLANADKLCTDLARSANLGGPFTAWLSSSALRNGNARDRLGPGGWLRVDGVGVAESPSELSLGNLVNPVGTNEWGEAINSRVWTGTDATGLAAVDPQTGAQLTCADWTTTSNQVFGQAGLSTTTKPDWTQGGALACDRTLPIYCFGGVRPSGGLVFVSSFYANLGEGFVSIESADDICNAAAQQSKRAGVFRAWLSDSTRNARDRIPDRAYFLPSGQLVASSIADLTDGSLRSPIEVDETGQRVGVGPDFPNVWTGTDQSGRAANHCNDWSPGRSMDGTQGRVNTTAPEWTDTKAPVLCQGSGRLYCFQVD